MIIYSKAIQNSRWRTRKKNEVCLETSYEIWVPKDVVSLSTAMQTLRVFVIKDVQEDSFVNSF